MTCASDQYYRLFSCKSPSASLSDGTVGRYDQGLKGSHNNNCNEKKFEKFTINSSSNDEGLSKHANKTQHIQMYVMEVDVIFLLFSPFDLLWSLIWLVWAVIMHTQVFGFLSLMYPKAIIFVSSFSFANKTA